MVDERDLGSRPAVEALLPLMERLDEERARLQRELEPLIATAVKAAHRGDHAEAAGIFDEVSRRFRAACFIGDADVWARRAADARTAARLMQRNARKGKGWR